MAYIVSNFYKFHNLTVERVSEIQAILDTKGTQIGVRGLILIGTEGINATIAGVQEDVSSYKVLLEELFCQILFKDNSCDYIPFRKLSVKVREEIVTLNRPDIVPGNEHKHLSPEEWDKMLEDEDVLVIDSRNWYEYEMGKFKSAIHLNINEFHQFPERLKEVSIQKDRKVLIYCTGGIRCEKAIFAMEEMGFQNVYQLDGGIIKYLEKFPNKKFEGECFVFDRRCAVDQSLSPTQRYDFCPHCGQPAEKSIQCSRCDNNAKVCDRCLQKSSHYNTCSKNCAHHSEIGSKCVKKKQSVTRQERKKSVIKLFKSDQ